MNPNTEKKISDLDDDENILNKRRIIYYLPLVSAKETIAMSGFRLVPFREESDYSNLLPRDIFQRNGTLLEIGDFKSGDFFEKMADQEIYDSLEKIKFGYFSLNPSHGQHIYGYVSSETFECFRLVEKTPDPSFEHKVSLSNGMYHFSHSLVKYYQARSAMEQRQISVVPEDFRCVDFLTIDITDANANSAMRLYNKCWGTYSLHSNYDKALLARVSIETAIKATGANKQNFIANFLDDALRLIAKTGKSSLVISTLEEKITSRKERIQKALEAGVLDLKTARDKFAHDGVQDLNHINIPFYLIWFPIYWMVKFKSEKMTENEHIRLCLFLCLLNYHPNQWQIFKISKENFRMKRSSLDIYAHYIRVLPVYLKNKRDDVVDITLKSIIKWINESDEIAS